MIKFFRRIRYDLMEKNKTGRPAWPVGRYFKYAIGEIVLVVIGILIALQLNNLNDEHKNIKEEIFILNNLNDNLDTALTQAKQQITFEEKMVKILQGILGLSDANSKINLDTISDKTFVTALWNIGPDTPILNTYVNLKNSNKLGLIRNQEIREKFTSLENSLEELNGMLDDRLIVHQTRIDDIAENDVNFVRLLENVLPDVDFSNESKNNYGELLHNNRVRNLFAIKLRMSIDVKEDRELLYKEIKDLQNLIQKELKRLE